MKYGDPKYQRHYEGLLAEGFTPDQAAAKTDAKALADLDRQVRADVKRAGTVERDDGIATEVLVEGDAEATLNTLHGEQDPEIVDLFGE